MVVQSCDLITLSPTVMYKFLAPLALFVATISSVCAQAPITVERVKFDAVGNDWMQVEIELMCNGNPSPDARNKDFVENIVVKPLIGYSLGKGEFQFYSAEVEVMIMEARDKNSVYFYMPGPVVERDDLPARPEYYYIEISVNGVAQEASRDGAAISSNISSLEMLQNMQSKAQSQLAENENLLLPVYFTPVEYSSKARNLPVFIRRESRQ